MSVRSNQNHKRAEEEGEAELVLAAVTYTGDRSMFGPQGMRTDGGYPALDQFRGPGPSEEEGETKLVELPSDRLGWWENHAHFEIAYDEESFARHMLGLNFIPDQLTGPGFNPDLREQFEEKLGLDPFTTEDGLREQLRDLVTDGDVEEPEIEETDTRAEKLVGEYDRSVLMKVAGTYDGIDDVLEEEDKSQISHLQSTTMAEFLSDQDDEEVDRRLATAEQGGEI